MKKVYFIVFTIIVQLFSLGFASEIDFSIDEEIVNKYSTKTIEKDLLPPLPKSYYEQDLDKETTPSQPQASTQKTETKQQTTKKQETAVTNKTKSVSPTIKDFYLLPGTKFTVKNITPISSYSHKGMVINFKTLHTQKYGRITVPSGSIFKATVEDAHKAQLSGNGGLIVLKFYEIVISGNTYPINAKISMANGKNIFFNKIKGERRYIKNLSKPVKPAGRFMSKMWNKTCKYTKLSPSIILTPFTLTSGLVVLSGATISAPVVSLFSKGQNISFPADTLFTIKIEK